MAKRFTSTEIWSEDWFLDMPTEYKLFWFYSLSACNHAGIFKVNMRSFCGLNGVKLTSIEVLNYFNSGKDRIRVVSENVWFFEDFIVFQYGMTLNINNRVHFSIMKELKNHEIALTSIRGLKDVNYTLKDKDKDINNLKEEKFEFQTPYQNVERFQKPILEEVKLYFVQGCKTEVTAMNFFNYYEGLGWMKGNSKIFNWRSFANNWEDKESPPTKTGQSHSGAPTLTYEQIKAKREANNR
jgi:hypothetical protein